MAVRTPASTQRSTGGCSDVRIDGFEYASTAMGILSPAMRWLDANRSLREMLGYGPEEFVGLTWPAVFPAAGAAEEEVRFANLISGGGAEYSGSACLKRKDGTLLPAGILLRVVRESRGMPTICTVEIRLRESRGLSSGAVEDLRIQYELELALLRAESLEEALRVSLDAVLRVSGLDCGGVYLVDAAGSLDLAVHRGLPEEFVRSAAHYDSGTPQARLVNSGAPLYTNYAELTMPRDEVRKAEALRGVGFVPVCFDGRVVACLNLASHSLEQVPAGARVSIDTIALRIGSALAHAKAADSLRQQRANLQMLFDSIRDLLVVTDMRGSILAVNRSIAALGYQPAALTGRPAVVLCPPEDAERVAAAAAEIVAGGPGRLTLDLLTKSGVRIPVETSLTHGTWDGQPALFGISRDISERKAAEQALKESESMLQSFFDSPGGIRGVVELLDGDILHISDNAVSAAFHGMTVEQMRLRRVSEMGMTAERIERLIAHYEESRRTRRPVTFEYRHRSVNGTRWLSQVVSYLGTGVGGRPRFTYAARDITSQKEAEERLRASEERYRAVVENQTELIVRFNAEGTLTFVNDVCCRFLGAAREALLGRPWRAFIVPEDLSAVEAKLRELTPASPVAEIERRVLAGDGHLHWMQLMGRGLFDADGRLVEVQAVSRDTTERKAAEEALAHTTEELESTYRHSLALLATLDMQGRFTRVNPEWTRALDYAPFELEGTSFFDLVHPDDSTASIERARMLSGGSQVPGFVQRVRAKDGSWHHLDLRMFLVGGRVHVAGLDITEKVRAEQALRESLRTLQTMFETMVQGVVWQEADGRIASVNPAAQSILGLSRDELMGRSSMDPRWRRVREDGSDFPLDALPSVVALATGRCVAGVVLGVFNPRTESHRWLSVSAIPCFDPGSHSPRGVYTIFEDITERRVGEDAARRAARMESVASLAGGIAHEFNNHLTVIMGTAELLSTGLARNRQDVLESLASLSGASRSCARLTEQLLAFAHGGNRVIRRVNLNETVRSVLNEASTFVPAGVRLKVELNHYLNALMGDPLQLRHVVDNLLRNAAEACSPHDRIRVLTRNRSFSETAAAELGLEPGAYVSLVVEDTGHGMDDATRARIFEPFFTTKFLGRGLGLAAAHGIVRAHKGAIRVGSAPGCGATFEVLLPAGTTEPEP